VVYVIITTSITFSVPDNRCGTEGKLGSFYESQLRSKLWDAKVDSEWRCSCWPFCSPWY